MRRSSIVIWTASPTSNPKSMLSQIHAKHREICEVAEFLHHVLFMPQLQLHDMAVLSCVGWWATVA